MNTAELIYQEARHLPEAQAREVLEFLVFLKAGAATPSPEHLTSETEAVQRKAALMECFSRYQVDMSNFKFDREEANARR